MNKDSSPRPRLNVEAIKKEILGNEAAALASPYPKTEATFAEPTFAGWAHQVFELRNSTSIFLGPLQSATNSLQVKASIEKHNVTAIVDCTMGANSFHANTVEYSRVPVRDFEGADIMRFLWGATAFMHVHLTGQRHRQNETQGGSVLVHCEMGRSRSATVVIAYLIKYQGMTRDEAYIAVKERRPQAQPNRGFWTQLGQFEEMVRNESNPPFVELPLENPSDHSSYMEWVIHSSATFATIGPIVQGGGHSTGGEEYFQGFLFGDLAGIDENNDAVLDAALDFLWDRGLLDIDLQWFVAFCNALQATFPNTAKSVKERALAILDNSQSDFCSRWAGEIYPPQVKKMHDILR